MMGPKTRFASRVTREFVRGYSLDNPDVMLEMVGSMSNGPMFIILAKRSYSEIRAFRDAVRDRKDIAQEPIRSILLEAIGEHPE